MCLERTRELQLRKIQASHDALEHKVEERTRELAEARSDLEKTELTFVKENADSLLGLVEDVIDASKIETGQIEIPREKFSLRELLDETVRSLSADEQRKGVDIEVSCPDGLEVYSNRRRVRQIALNLPSNALKATEEGRIEVVASENPGSVSLVVTDPGTGIAEEDLERIFQPFNQVTTSDRPKDGAGLGLYLSQKTAELLGGAVTVTSTPGRGSMFTLTIPA